LTALSLHIYGMASAYNPLSVVTKTLSNIGIFWFITN